MSNGAKGASLTVFVYTSDIDNTSASEIRDALNAREVCVRPLADMPEKPPLVTSDGHIYHHNANCCRRDSEVYYE